MQILMFLDHRMKVFKIFVHFLFNVVHFELAEKGLSFGLKPELINEVLMVFFGEEFESLLHFGDGVVNIFAELHIFKSVDSCFLKMAEAFDLKFGWEDIAEEDLFRLL